MIARAVLALVFGLAAFCVPELIEPHVSVRFAAAVFLLTSVIAGFVLSMRWENDWFFALPLCSFAFGLSLAGSMAYSIPLGMVTGAFGGILFVLGGVLRMLFHRHEPEPPDDEGR